MQATDPSFDLGNPTHYTLVKRIYWRRFAPTVIAADVDPEDGLQTVCLHLLVKSKSERSRWVPGRGSMSTWVYVAMKGIVLNLLQSGRRHWLDLGEVGDVSEAATQHLWGGRAPSQEDHVCAVEAIEHHLIEQAREARRQPSLFQDTETHAVPPDPHDQEPHQWPRRSRPSASTPPPPLQMAFGFASTSRPTPTR